MEQSGVLAALSRRRPRVQIPLGGLYWHSTQTGKATKLKLWRTSVGSTPTCATWRAAFPMAVCKTVVEKRWGGGREVQFLRGPICKAASGDAYRVGQCPAVAHNHSSSGATPEPGTLGGRVRKPGKAIRSRAWCLWVRLPPRSLFVPVVQRQRRLVYTQATMVRVHPGSLLDKRSCNRSPQREQGSPCSRCGLRNGAMQRG